MKLVEPPVALRFHRIDYPQLQAAKDGVCPHCPRPVQINSNAPFAPSRTLNEKHRTDGIKFLQCSRCLVVVALPA